MSGFPLSTQLKSGWESIPLGAVCDLVSGQHILAKDYNADGNGVGYLTGPADFGELYPIVSRWTEKPKVKARRGDILITVKGSGVGKINLVRQVEVAISRQLMAIRLRRIVDHRFVYLFLHHQFSVFQKLRSGAAIPGISRKDVLNMVLPAPPLDEQKRIVAILDEAFEGIETATAHAERNLHNARELFQSVLQSTFDQKGEDWVETTFWEVCENLDSKRVPITKNKREAGDFPYYGASDVVDYVNDYIFDEDLLLVSEDGANLLARTYPIAFSVSGKIWVNNHAHVLRFPTIDLQRFLEFYLNSIKLDPFVNGMAQPKLNQKSLNRIPVFIPPQEQQGCIVEKLDSLAAETRRLEAIYQRKLDALSELKQSLLHRAFAGEL